MNSRDRQDVIDAIVTFTGPIVAEFRAYRAEVAAYRAESRADFERLEGKVDALDRDVQAIANRVFGEDE